MDYLPINERSSPKKNQENHRFKPAINEILKK
jgi:hypothetical protein